MVKVQPVYNGGSFNSITVLKCSKTGPTINRSLIGGSEVLGILFFYFSFSIAYILGHFFFSIRGNAIKDDLFEHWEP